MSNAGSTVDDPMSRREGPEPARRLTPTSGILIKLGALMLVNATALWGMWRMVEVGGQTLMLVFTVLAAAAINLIYLSKRTVPLKYLIPGTLLLLVFVVYPVLYTVYISFTNFGTGNILNKEQAVARLVANSVRTDAEGITYSITPLRNGEGELALLMEGPDGGLLLGLPTGAVEIDDGELVRDGERIVGVDDYAALDLGEVQSVQNELLALEIPVPTGVARVQTFSTARVASFGLRYDADRDVIVDTVTGEEYTPLEGRFVSTDDGESLVPGWRAVIGPDNYERVVTNDAIRGPFSRVLIWTFVFSLATVITSLALGLGLALALHHETMAGKRLYRSIMIIPYAIPSFMTALVWRGMMNRDFGILNDLLPLDVNWLGDPNMAKVSVVLVNLWLGFPYMFLVSTGALQAIPSDVLEAARVDGANGPQTFRRVTFPLLLITLAPLLIASFAFNFNNFNIIFFVTGGGPPIIGADTPVGHTDILISYTYALAFESGRGQDLGFAAAISVMIFLIVATISAISFSKTKAFEEIDK